MPLFSMPSPEAVRQNARQGLFKQAQQIAAAPRGRGFVQSAAQAGGLFGEAIGRGLGGKLPGEQKAEDFQAVQAQITQEFQDQDLSDPQTQMDMMGKSAQLLGQAGFQDQAVMAMQEANKIRESIAKGIPKKGSAPKPTGSTEGFFVIGEDGQPEILKHPETGEVLKPSFANPDMAGKVVSAKVRAEAREALITTGYNTIEGIRQNKINLLEAKRLITEEGASTGFVQELLPDMFAGTIKLKNVQKKLGLNIVGATTFGALSAGELKLALQTGLPTALTGKPLTDWINRKLDADEKLASYLSEQIEFVDAGGTREGWLKKKRAEKKAAESGKLPEGVTESDIKETMKANNMTRIQVLQRLNE